MSASRNAVRLRDVALACGVHTSTICLALKHAPSIPTATRQRIQAVARALGYRPNAAARHLVLLRADRTAGSTLPLAWINQEPARHHWHTDASGRAHYQAASQRAAELGYHLEEIWAGAPGLTPARLVQIVLARGIAGALLPLHRRFDAGLLQVAWGDVSLVGLHDHRLGEWIDLVSADYYTDTDRMLRRLRQLGFRRIGLVLEEPFHAATQGRVHACFARHLRPSAEAFPLPICRVEDTDRDRALIEAWLMQYQPDAVIGQGAKLVEWVRAIRPGAAIVQLHGPVAGFDAGTEAAECEVAQVAVDCLVDKMRRFERGVGARTRVHLIKGSWHESHLHQIEPQPVVA